MGGHGHGHSWRRKKKRGGARRNKDHNSTGGSDDGGEVVAEELTALCAIFQEDCLVVSQSPPQINIHLRPYSNYTGYEDSDVSALLSVRCLPGYPYKSPKLLLTPQKGLSKAHLDTLLSLLHDQAQSNAREGRVMIYNLVEAAQEFLSEVAPVGKPQELAPCLTTDRSSQISQKDAAILSKTRKGPFVYGFVDLFSGCGESWHWSLAIEESDGVNSFQTRHLDSSQTGYEILDEKVDQNGKTGVIQDSRQESVHSLTINLDTLEEEGEEEESKGTDSSRSFSVDSLDDGTTGEDLFLDADLEETDDGDLYSNPSDSLSSASLAHYQLPHSADRDLLLAHLLRLACAPNGPLADALPDIASELFDLGIVSDRVRELATKPSALFDRTFKHAFGQQMVSSKRSEFWKIASDSKGLQPSSTLSSRYLNDFEELQSVGRGGFGHVVLCKNKLDGRQYAVKKIRLKDKGPPLNDRILREVATLSRLQHQHVVRYYQAWFETGVTDCHGDIPWGSKTAPSSSFSDASLTDATGHQNKVGGTFLYIQMEYCPRTLRQMFESYAHFDKELAWHLFRQIVEGLAHIHGQGIIHRDLTPNNIFFDARNDIKIGDFGLAKFLKLEQLEQDPDIAETTGVSIDGTGQVGTYFYTAPEIEQRWPKINEKADMYSLGVVFLELWHPFSTGMERHIVLSDLKKKGELPSEWVAEFPEQASLLQRLMASIPSDRPSATELLKNAFPPRMEYELLDNILRRMNTSDDGSIYDKVVDAIFNEETLGSKENHDHVGRPKLISNDTSPIQYAHLDTEIRDQVVRVTSEVFTRHCARHLEIIPMRLLGDSSQFTRSAVKLLTDGGDMIELCRELRLPFINWIVANQKSSFKRYEISSVYRRPIGHSPPNRYLQGDFDVIGGASALTEAEVVKVAMDIITRFFHPESCDIHLNHGDLLDAIWSWIGIKADHRQKVAELLSLLGSLRPQSSERKSKWAVIRRQFQQELNLSEGAVNRLQTVGLRFCGIGDQALPRLRGALPSDKPTRKALDELSELFSYLRIWKTSKHVFIDPLMPPTESYHRDLFFQIYSRKDNSHGSLVDGTLLAVGGRYDSLLHQMWNPEYKSNPPAAVGASIALETIIQHTSADINRPFSRYDGSTSSSVLVCSRGGGGLLEERMELVAELWEDNIKAELVPQSDPSLTEQYEYANEHDIKYLIIITDDISQTASVKVRHLELKRGKEIERQFLVKFLLEAMASQFRNPSIWN